MAENSKIEWTKHTASPWYGCSRVHAGCEHCYAEQLSKRNPGTLGVWGEGGTRIKSKSFIKNLRQWNREAERAGEIAPVFPSMCDPFEDRPELVEWRNEMFAAADELPWIRLLLLTKRPENVRRMWPDYSYHACVTGDCPHERQSECDSDSGRKFRENIAIGTSISDQATADEYVPELLKLRDLTPTLFLSAEPLLGPVNLTRIPTGHWAYGKVDVMSGYLCGAEPDEMRDWEADPHGWVRKPAGEWERGPVGIDWLIVGGESGPHARPMHPDWARSLRDQCQAAGVPFFFKQWGEWIAQTQLSAAQKGEAFHYSTKRVKLDEDRLAYRLGKKAAGRLLDGREWSEFPTCEPTTNQPAAAGGG